MEDKTSVIVYGSGAVALLWISSTVVGAINGIPLIPKFLELVGLGYTAWFTYRYLLFKVRPARFHSMSLDNPLFSPLRVGRSFADRLSASTGRSWSHVTQWWTLCPARSARSLPGRSSCPTSRTSRRRSRATTDVLGVTVHRPLASHDDVESLLASLNWRRQLQLT